VNNIHNTISQSTPILQTTRTYLKEFTLDEVELLARIYSNQVIMQNSIFGVFTTGEIIDLMMRIQDSYQQNQFGIWGVFRLTDSNFLGICGIEVKLLANQERNTLTYRFHEQCWGQGYASEVVLAVVQYAFTKLKLENLHAIIKPDNVVSKKIAINAGLQYNNIQYYNGHEVAHYQIQNPMYSDKQNEISNPDNLLP
jgi:[ribosomal protein S5]-alanine N-acetyltransferase